MTYDNAKSHKKPGFHPTPSDTFFKKPQEGQTDPPSSRFRVNPLQPDIAFVYLLKTLGKLLKTSENLKIF